MSIFKNKKDKGIETLSHLVATLNKQVQELEEKVNALEQYNREIIESYNEVFFPTIDDKQTTEIEKKIYKEEIKNFYGYE